MPYPINSNRRIVVSPKSGRAIKSNDPTKENMEFDLGDLYFSADGSLRWVSNKVAVNTELANAILSAFNNNLQDLQAAINNQTRLTVTIQGSDPTGEKRFLGNAIGHAFEYYFHQNLSRVAREFPQIQSVKMATGVAFIMDGIKAVKQLVSVPQLMLQLYKQAEQSARMYLSDLVQGMEESAKVNITLEGIGGDDARGDIRLAIEQILNNGKVKKSLDYWIELKAYSSSTVTYATLSDSNFVKTLARYLYEKPQDQIYWTCLEDTEKWAYLVQTSGLKGYFLQLASVNEIGSANMQPFLAYLVKKAGKDLALSRRRMVVANTSSNKITISLDLDAILSELAQKKITGQFSTIGRGTQLAFQYQDLQNRKQNLAYLRLAEKGPSQIKNQSAESKTKTKEIGPDWTVPFEIELTKTFYNYGRS